MRSGCRVPRSTCACARSPLAAHGGDARRDAGHHRCRAAAGAARNSERRMSQALEITLLAGTGRIIAAEPKRARRLAAQAAAEPAAGKSRADASPRTPSRRATVSLTAASCYLPHWRSDVKNADRSARPAAGELAPAEAVQDSYNNQNKTLGDLVAHASCQDNNSPHADAVLLTSRARATWRISTDSDSAGVPGAGPIRARARAGRPTSPRACLAASCCYLDGGLPGVSSNALPSGCGACCRGDAQPSRRRERERTRLAIYRVPGRPRRAHHHHRAHGE